MLYETHRDVVERVLKSGKYRSFGDVLGQLFREKARKQARRHSAESSRSRAKEASRRAVLSRKALTQLHVGKLEKGSARGSARSGRSARKDDDLDSSWSAAGQAD